MNRARQCPAEPEPEKHFVSAFTVDHEDHGTAQEAQPVGEHASDRARAVSELKSTAVAGPRCRRNAQISPHRQTHSHKTNEPGERCSHEESCRSSDRDLLHRFGCDVDQESKHQHEPRDRLELPGEISVRTLTNRRGNLAHLVSALISADNLVDQPKSINQSSDGNTQHHPQRDLLHEAIRRVGGECEVLKLRLSGRGRSGGAGPCGVINSLLGMQPARRDQQYQPKDRVRINRQLCMSVSPKSKLLRPRRIYACRVPASEHRDDEHGCS